MPARLAPLASTSVTGKEKEGSDPEGKPKGSTKAEALNIVDRLIDPLSEGGHKPGCTCGFCKNKGRGFKKKTDTKAEDSPKTDDQAKDSPKTDSETVEKTFEAKLRSKRKAK
jgi:hypothetical protein